mmetsp:Transcript_9647/g.12926  ORF Transcript_9647/g.12926 Transcript_9647/m.12926 type:complete len:81 (+) Transcript_9647:1-243(+)
MSCVSSQCVIDVDLYFGGTDSRTYAPSNLRTVATSSTYVHIEVSIVCRLCTLCGVSIITFIITPSSSASYKENYKSCASL